MKAYWKKRYIPDCCPVCGAKQADELIAKHPPKSVESWGRVFQGVFTSWRIKLMKHPEWRIPCWYAWCGNCSMFGTLREDMSLFEMVKKDKPSSNWELPVRLRI